MQKTLTFSFEKNHDSSTSRQVPLTSSVPLDSRLPTKEGKQTWPARNLPASAGEKKKKGRKGSLKKKIF